MHSANYRAVLNLQPEPGRSLALALGMATKPQVILVANAGVVHDGWFQPYARP